MIRNNLLTIYLLASFFGMGQAIQFGTLGGGFSNQSSNAVRALYYDTLDKKLYAGGQFHTAEGKTVWGAAVWNGSYWDSLTGGLTQYPQVTPGINQAGPVVWKIIRYKDKIYFLGGFYWVNGKNQYNMAVWNGTNWDYPQAFPLTSNSFIYDMKVHNGILYACGDFTKIGNVTCNYVAKFDGTSWQPVGDFSKFHLPNHPPVLRAIEIYNNEIYVGGQTDDTSGEVRNIAKFDGNSWVNVGTGIRQGGVNYVYALQAYNNKLYIGGYFSHTDEIPGEGLVAWNGSAYVRAAEYDLNGSGNIYQFIRHKDKLAVLGGFYKYGPHDATGLLFIDPHRDCYIDEMMPLMMNPKYAWYWGALASIGDSLIIGGQFNYIDTFPAKNIAFIRNEDGRSNCVLTGIKESSLDKAGINIFPNPVTDKLIIEVIETQKMNLSISNSLGQEIYTINGLSGKQEIDISSFAGGIYILRLQNNSIQKTFKIIKESEP